jgi:hypothetical protein
VRWFGGGAGAIATALSRGDWNGRSGTAVLMTKSL